MLLCLCGSHLRCLATGNHESVIAELDMYWSQDEKLFISWKHVSHLTSHTTTSISFFPLTSDLFDKGWVG